MLFYVYYPKAGNLNIVEYFKILFFLTFNNLHWIFYTITEYVIAKCSFQILRTLGLPLQNESLIYCGSQLLRTRSIGTVSLRSTNPYGSPLIDPNFLADFQDVEDMVQGKKNVIYIFVFFLNFPHKDVLKSKFIIFWYSYRMILNRRSLIFYETIFNFYFLSLIFLKQF